MRVAKNQFRSKRVEFVKSVKRVKNKKELAKEAELAITQSLAEDNIRLDDESKVVEAVLIEVDQIEDEESEIDAFGRKPSAIEDILFKLPIVSEPLIGTPKQVQKCLDRIAIRIRRNPDTNESKTQFDRIHLYIHGYLINIALKQFPYIKGLQTVDVYQES